MRFLILFIACFLLSFSQPSSSFNTKGEMAWNKNKLLVWSDFRKKASTYEIAGDAALTTTSIQVGTSLLGKELTITVVAKFYPYQSWTVKSKQSDGLLHHEQLHFDITELIARQLRKELLETIKTKKDYSKMNHTVETFMKKWDDIQELYDQESDHNRDDEGQAKWNKFIPEELEQYSEYQQTELQIILK